MCDWKIQMSPCDTGFAYKHLSKNLLARKCKMNKIVALSSSLSADYEKLFESSKYTDISIHVGKEPNNKIFLAHTLVLCTRSKFFENILTENTEMSEEVQKPAIMFEDVSPDVFEIMLKYIYTGELFYDSCKSIGWVNLLEGASKFELLDLVTALETYLIDNQQEWIQQNFLTVYKFVVSAASLNKLLDYCNQSMVSHPDIIFKSNDITALPKETLITLLKNDELNMNEDEVCASVIQWAAKQVPELQLGSDLKDWSSNDINTIKDIITDFIPCVRFFNMSPKKIVLYRELLPRDLYCDILSYLVDNDYKPNTHTLPPRMGQVDSLIINREQAGWISSKIVESTRRLQENQRTLMKKDVYKFTLLYRRSRDGDTVAKFRELCSEKGPTISVGKVLGTEEILGGYHPVAWERNVDIDVDTEESFIFALDGNSEKSIVSFIDDEMGPMAVGDSYEHYPIFGSMNDHDLYFGDGKSLKPFASKNLYQVPIRSSSDIFEWADWEVFLVSKL